MTTRGTDAVTTRHTAHCPGCNLTRLHAAFRKNGYEHMRCHWCGTIFVVPTPAEEEIVAFYRRQSGEQNSTMCWDSSRQHCVPLWNWTLSKIESIAGCGRLLDIGCGAGQFLAHARQHGWEQISGIELSRQAAALARQLTGAEIQTEPLQGLNLPTGSFAAITMWDVIEHLTDIRGVLAEVRRLLLPGGVLALSTPNPQGLTLRLRGSKALAVMPPEHLTYFSAKGMLALMTSAGFEVDHVRTVDVYLRELTRMMVRETGGNNGRGARERESYRRQYARLTNAPFFPAAMRAMNVILNGTRLGDQLVVVSHSTAAA